MLFCPSRLSRNKSSLIRLAKCTKDSILSSSTDSNFYGVRLHQKWKSTNYSDEGYVFLLWNFTSEDKPQIEVRTWQPDMVGNQKVAEDDIISLGDFEDDIVGM